MKDNHVLTKYELISGLPINITFALVTDLHEHDPEPVLRLLREAHPDIIFVAGDTFERSRRGKAYPRAEYSGRLKQLLHKCILRFDDLFDFIAGPHEATTENAYKFLRGAAAIRDGAGHPVPVCLSLGNHEQYLKAADRQMMADAGITLLDNAHCHVDIRGQRLHIGGLSSTPDLKWLQRFAAKDGYKILLCHHPEYYFRYMKDKLDIDLILSGHAHGGQWCIGGQGIYSPGQGLFPKYTRGVYEDHLIVSAGCANTASVPRFGNPCEVVLVRL